MIRSAPQVIVHVVASPATGEPYDVRIGPGCADRLGDALRAHAPAFRYAVVADDVVARLHGERLVGRLRDEGLKADLFTFGSGESNKSRASWAALIDAMLARGIARDACVVAIGGGVTGDLAGFVAATYMRGIPYVQVPTTLLAMIDASVGGKTGIDVPAGKNLVGAFVQPRAVIADPLLLATLPDVHFRAGIAEAVKHGMIADAAYFEWITANAAALLDRDPAAIATLVRRSVEIKADVVAEDTLETARRATLNFGHTVAHALEHVTNFELIHGFAVALGMLAECRVGELLGVTAPETGQRLAGTLERLRLPVRLPVGTDPDRIVEATRFDKKARAGLTRCALVARVGGSARTESGDWTFDVSDPRLRAALDALPIALSQENTEV
jgi:3-dehydroquinate synthase